MSASNIPKCAHTGLPILMCAHCVNGLAAQREDPGHPYNRTGPVVFYTKSSDRMRNAAVEGSRRGAYGTPRTAWGQQQQLRTVLDLYREVDEEVLTEALEGLQL